MSACSYPETLAGSIYSYTQLIVIVVPACISAMAVSKIWYFLARRERFGVQFLHKWYGTWMLVMAMLVAIAQSNQNVLRPDPYCPDIIDYAFPSMTAFVVASLVTYVFLYTYLWNVVLPWVWWAAIETLLLLPAVFVWFGVNTWLEILVSTLIGVVTTAVYLIAVRVLVARHVPMLLRLYPSTVFGCVDNLLMSIRQQQWSEYLGALMRENRTTLRHMWAYA